MEPGDKYIESVKLYIQCGKTLGTLTRYATVSLRKILNSPRDTGTYRPSLIETTWMSFWVYLNISNLD